VVGALESELLLQSPSFFTVDPVVKTILCQQ
jgi:hypothetical protein